MPTIDMEMGGTSFTWRLTVHPAVTCTSIDALRSSHVAVIVDAPAARAVSSAAIPDCATVATSGRLDCQLATQSIQRGGAPDSANDVSCSVPPTRTGLV